MTASQRSTPKKSLNLEKKAVDNSNLFARISNKHIVGDIFFKISNEFLDEKTAANLGGVFSLFRKHQLLQKPKRARSLG